MTNANPHGPKLILGLFTGLLSHGGIERMGRHIAAVLSSVGAKHEIRVQLLSLNDPEGLHQVKVADAELHVRGFGRSKVKFVAGALLRAPYARLTYIAHPNFAPLGPILAFPMSRPYFVGTYGIDVWEPLPILNRVSLNRAKKVFTISKSTARALREFQGIPESKVVIIPPAIDPGIMRLVEGRVPFSVSSLRSRKMALTVTRLMETERYKGVDVVIKALPKVVAVVPDIQYIVVGDGDDRHRLEKLAQDLSMQDHVSFVGSKTNEELADYYSACDLYVMPSKNEGFGLVYLEAMAFGKPVIASNTGAPTEFISHERHGLLVDPDSVDDVANALVRLFTNPALAKRLGHDAQIWVRDQYSFDRFHLRLTNEIEPVLQERKRKILGKASASE
jgi:glycosyltransferase involved in cell wall biosynthesis